MGTFDLDTDRTLRLFNYLKELSLLRTPLVQDLNKYNSIFWINKIPNEPECTSPLHQDIKDDLWLEIKKPFIPVVPELPIVLERWLEESSDLEDINQEPTLKEKVNNPIYTDDTESENNIENHVNEYLYIEDHPDIIELFSSYLTNHWIPWKNEYIRTNGVQKIYSKLFSIYQNLKISGEQYELIMAVGLFNWKTPTGQMIHRHLLTIPCAFSFDSDTGLLSVNPSTENLDILLEQDMLELAERLDADTLKPIEDILDNLKENFWNKDTLDLILRSYVQSLSAEGNYWPEEYNEINDISNKPNVFFSPALILRKRNEKGFQQACSSIINDIEEGIITIPQGIQRIFNEIDDEQFKNEDDLQLVNTEDSHIYFPLEANDEQIKIIERLQTRNGVIVQGPPGTGKSHTIANLTSHLLATGKRILITSQTPRALKVLKDKIPDELKALCVSLLGEDSNSFKDLENVVYGISNMRDSWDPEDTKLNIDDLTDKLRTLKEKEAELKLNLKAIREKDTFTHHLMDEYSGTAQNIAKTLNKNRSKYEWLNDQISLDSNLPITNDESVKLLQLLEELDEDVIEQINYSFPSLETLFNPDKFEELSKRENELKTLISNLRDYESDQLHQYKDLDSDSRHFLEQTITKLLSMVQDIEKLDITWLNRALQDLISNKFSTWEEFYVQFKSTIDDIKNVANKHNLIEINGLPDKPLSQIHAEVIDLKKHLEIGKGLGIPLLRPKPVKTAWYIIQDVRYDGQKTDNLETVSLLEEALHIDISLNKIEKLIHSHLEISLEKKSSRGLRIAEITDCLQPFDLLYKVKILVEGLKQKYNDHSFIKEIQLTSLYLNKLFHELQLLHYKNELHEVNSGFTNLIQNINNSIEGSPPHSCVNQLLAAIERRNEIDYRILIEEIKKLDVFTQKNILCEEIMQKIKSQLPKLYNQLLDDFNYDIWSKRFEVFEQAFKWGKANTWHLSYLSSDEKEVKNELNNVEESIRKITSELGSQKAWFSTLSAMTENQRKHLLAWKTAIRKAGKRTGPNAPLYLRDAKFHMSQCQDAIPAWIMPLYRIFETFEMKPNLFDYVIIDEASQSGPDAVILQYLAKNLIVVGDDKQISPEHVGVKKEDVDLLRKKFLFDFKLGDLLDIESSFFDLTNVLFGGRITLREHFRCMPEIIQFSNIISYSHTPLVPLRQYPPNRLEPVMIRHVANGFKEGSGQKVLNKPEAEAIVKEIKLCIQNPNYKNKSIGVISLQNKGQAKLIEHLLIQEIGTEEIEKRNIICGDAYDFQGDERDIIFISLVAAPGEKGMRAINTEKDKRRFNVAVSRAKDQLWLFHTPTTNDFKNKECLRYQLINYCQNPNKEILESNRKLCESDFERSVFDQISWKGFRVIPQYKVAGYRIDLVVEGEKGRIAVECDGDEWHGPDRYEQDMSRQRILERCGWKFWRVRGSQYYYDPEKALNSLWDTLEYYNIKPTFNNQEKVSETTENKTFKQRISITKRETKDVLQLEESIDTIKSTQISHTDKRNDNNMQPMKEINDDFPGEQVEFFSDELNGFHQQISMFDDDAPILNTNISIDNLKKEQLFDLKDYLLNKGFEVIDKRENGGALWLVGGKELTPIIQELKRKKVHFSFTENGSRSTKRRPAWFIK